MKATPRISQGAVEYRAGTRDRVLPVGSDGWWRWLEAATVVLLRDGRAVDTERISLLDADPLGEGFQLTVSALQLP